MTDLRLLECAKALYESPGSPEIAKNDAVWQSWDALRPVIRDHYIIQARACILKWLEQEPSAGMVAAEIPGVPYPESGFGWLHWPIKLDGHLDQATAPQVYTAMNAQAAKELKGTHG